MKKGNELWFANIGQKILCPHPECEHAGEVITKAHVRIQHGMEREELSKKYGYPVQPKVDHKKKKQNLSMNYNKLGWK